MKKYRLPEWNITQLHDRIREQKDSYLKRPRYLKKAVLYAIGKAGEWRNDRKLTPCEEAILSMYVDALKISDDRKATQYLFSTN